MLNAIEEYSIDYSLKWFEDHEVLLIGPDRLDLSYYLSRYPGISFSGYDPYYFSSIQGYNHLLLSEAFYEKFLDFEFTLILQTDAIVLRNELPFWCSQPFDYVGAPWPGGLELFVNLGKFEGANGRRVRTMVGNGGLSLRRNKKCIALLQEFPEAIDYFHRSGSSEDLFFSFMGPLSNDFVMPNEITASRFALELNPSFYFFINGHHLPMGGHAWWKYDLSFWRQALPSLTALDGYF